MRGAIFVIPIWLGHQKDEKLKLKDLVLFIYFMSITGPYTDRSCAETSGFVSLGETYKYLII